MTQSVRLKIIHAAQETLERTREFQTNAVYRQRIIETGGIDKYPLEMERIDQTIERVLLGAERVISDLNSAKVVVFPAEQAEVFMDAIGKVDFNMNYKLPFPITLLQFSEPILSDLREDHGVLARGQVGALLLSQEIGSDGFSMNLGFLIEKSLYRFRPFFWEEDGDDLLPSHPQKTESGETVSASQIVERMTMIDIKNLAIACIGYINCENVYLHPVESASESINAKRERKGKSRLEPYYVCRIRGVQYDSAGNPTGEGAKHGIRYDVRGHFRRMTNGKTTWVRPHQRGLANELYVPKTYVVDRIDS